MTALPIAVALLLLPSGPPPAKQDAQWVRLFNGKNLDGWYTFLQKHGKNSDPGRVITIEDGMIRLYRHAKDGDEVVMGYIGTQREYGDYHLRFEYRWGQKKFQPRYALKRDAGLYYHIIGDDAVWPKALQYQVQETDIGDLLALYGFQVDTWSDPKTVREQQPTFLSPESGGAERTMGGRGIAYQKRLPGDFEKPGWNTAEIIVQGTSVTHVLNGTIVNRARNVRFVDSKSPEKSQAITKGRIALEIEAAELDFRNVEIKDLSTKK